jgi:hypothetical protein
MQETSGTCTIYRKFGYCRVCQHDLDELQATAETSVRGSYLLANNIVNKTGSSALCALLYEILAAGSPDSSGETCWGHTLS